MHETPSTPNPLASQVATQEQVKADLQDGIAGRIDRCISAALQEYVEKYKDLRRKHRRGTEASIIRDIIVDQIVTEFEGAANAKGRVVHGTYELTILDKYKVRFKKLDRALRVSNIDTQATIDFRGQVQFAELAVTNLHVGYQIGKEAELTSAKRWVVCPKATGRHWRWEITGLGNEQVAPLPLVAGDQTPPPRKLVKMRVDNTKKVAEADNVVRLNKAVGAANEAK